MAGDLCPRHTAMKRALRDRRKKESVKHNKEKRKPNGKPRGCFPSGINHPNAKLTLDNRNEIMQSDLDTKELSDKYGVTQRYVRKIRQGRKKL